MTNAYCSLAQAKSAFAIDDTLDDALLTLCVNAASRSIDKYTGKTFFVDATVSTRYFYPQNTTWVQIPEGISTTDDLVVKTDVDADAVFETTLVLDTDFVLQPVNAPVQYPVRPYTKLVTINSSLPVHGDTYPGVEITAKFGWEAVPDDVTMACILLTHDLFKAKDAPFGVAGAAEFGVLRVRRNQTVVELLSPFRPALVA